MFWNVVFNVQFDQRYIFHELLREEILVTYIISKKTC